MSGLEMHDIEEDWLADDNPCDICEVEWDSDDEDADPCADCMWRDVQFEDDK